MGKVVLLGIPLAIALAATRTSATPGQPRPAPGPPPRRPPPRNGRGGGNGGGSGGGGGTVLAGSTWWDAIPEQYSAARDRAIVGAVAKGNYGPLDWWNVISEGTGELAGYQLEIPVMTDALHVEGVRVTAPLPVADEIAQLLGLQMLTPFVAGLVSEQAHAQLSPTTAGNDLSVKTATANTSQMREASAVVDRKLAPVKAARDAAGESTLVRNPGKDWVITIRNSWPGVHPQSGVPHTKAAANHGLFSSPWNPIQNVGLFHGLDHVDYSQTLRYMGPQVILRAPDDTAQLLPTAEVMQSAELAELITGVQGRAYGTQLGEGALPFHRHPLLAAA